MRGGGDHRARRLAEDAVEPDHGDDFGLDQVLEGLAGADRRQLVGVADEDDVGRLGKAPEQDLGQPQVQHRGLVDDDEVNRERMVWFVMGLPSRRPLQHAVNRLRFVVGRFLQPAGGAAGGGAESDLDFGFHRRGHDRPRTDGLADAGAAGEDRDP